ncbi:nucleotidyl transferase AbiEii/AbiGii toxin family protein [Sphaerimonospora sp. CA-214678]|uniref:nucleotidyl transferase AbiEii/AbiGii toxin family protein n=1 Tax=Sphaerimonospora sp. CA-214678 TaxID=3240029 RepID=UPI003D8FAA16
MTRVELPPFHLRLVEDARAVLDRYGLLLAGGYALRAHGRTDRPVDDLTFATGDETPPAEIAEAMAAAFRATGLAAEVGESGRRTGRVVATDVITGQTCEVTLLGEVLRDRHAAVEPCPVVGLDDVVGLKVRALHDRGLPRDFADVASVSDLYGFRSLERLGARHDDDWRTEHLIERLETVDLLADEAFGDYGLDEERIAEVRRFVYAWVEDIKLRRVDDGDAEFDLDIPEID